MNGDDNDDWGNDGDDWGEAAEDGPAGFDLDDIELPVTVSKGYKPVKSEHVSV